MQSNFIGEKMDVERLYDAVNMILYLQVIQFLLIDLKHQKMISNLQFSFNQKEHTILLMTEQKWRYSGMGGSEWEKMARGSYHLFVSSFFIFGYK